MRIITWNVNGIRAVLKKNFLDFLDDYEPDILCLQETKARKEQVSIDLSRYAENIWNSAEKPGYSGTAIFSKKKSLMTFDGIGKEEHDKEGRVQTMEFHDFYLVNCYTPNSQNELMRLDYRMQWEKDFLLYLKKLDEKKPVVLCGDLNVAHEEIDLARPVPNMGKHGFSYEERTKFSEMLAAGFVDVFRSLHPSKIQYTWWAYYGNCRTRNVGWRIDYFITSKRLLQNVKQIKILDEVHGSDHCPVMLELK